MERRAYTPRPYQHLMVGWMLDHPRCAVWAGMGLGKSSSTLSALSMLQLVEPDPVLVIAPLRVARYTWPNEVKKWDAFKHLHVLPIVGSEAERRITLKYDAPIYSVNFENLPWLVEHYGERWPFRSVVVDEATRLKGFRLKQGTARARALAGVAHTKVKRMIQLTGTPSPNGLIDLWGQAWFLDAGERLGRTFEAFQNRWFAWQRRPNQDGSNQHEIAQIPMQYSQIEIQDKLRDLCLSIDAADYFDLDEPIVNNVYVEMPAKARIKYREMEKRMFAEIEGHEIEAFTAAAKTQKLLQLANGAAYVGEPDAPGERQWVEVHDAKLAALESIVEEANGMPVLVAYQFKSDRARILRAFPKFVDLATDEGFKAFMDGKAQGGLAHPKSMGHGIDGMQDVTNIIAFFSSNWNLEEDMQIIERIGPTRQMQSGHKRPVFIHRIMAHDTVDDLVRARRETKREVQDILLEAMKGGRA